MKKLGNSRGFTIIELLIATVSFSLILLIITGAIIQFSRVYYKGVVTSKAQEVARVIAEDMARSAQFSPGSPSSAGPAGGYSARCFGDKRYNFILDRQLMNEVSHVLTVDNELSCTAFNASTGLPPAASDATEFLGEGMQLLDLTVSGSDTVTISVTVAYAADADLDIPNRRCRPIILGGQFCAVSTITTTVTKRL